MSSINNDNQNIIQSPGNGSTGLGVEHRELDLSNFGDLNLFVESAQSVCDEAVVLQSTFDARGYEKLAIGDILGKEIFDTILQKLDELQKVTEVCRYKIVTSGEAIEDYEIELIQALYDDLVILRNHVLETHSLMSEAEEKVEESLVISENEQTELVVENESSEVVPIKRYETKKINITSESTEIEKEPEKIIEKKEPEKPREIGSEEKVDPLKDYRAAVRNELAAFLKKKGYQKIKQRLDRTLNRAKSKSDIESVKKSILESSEWNKKSDSKTTTTKENPSKKINEKVREVIKKSDTESDGFDNDETFSSFVKNKRKTMTIEPGVEYEGDISIQVSKEAAKRVEEEKDKIKPAFSKFTPQSIVVKENMKKTRRSIVAQLEGEDPINKVIKGKVPTIIHARPIHEEDSLTQSYLTNKKYVSFIKKYYTSLASFERMLDTTVTQIESSTVDVFERMFDDKSASAFVFLKRMTVDDVLRLSMLSDAKSKLQTENIKYETFVFWVDSIKEMQAIVGPDTNITFGELYALWMIETEMQYYLGGAVR